MNIESESWKETLVSFLTDAPPSNQLEQAITKIDLIEDFDTGIVDEIPFVSTLVAGFRTARNIQTRFLLRKLLRFFSSGSEIPQEERSKFLGQLDVDAFYRQRVTDGLIILLDRYDHIDKAYLLGKLLAGFILEKMDEEAFWRIGAAINQAYIGDLRHLLVGYSELYYRVEPWERLHASGLAKLKVDVKVGREYGLIEEVKLKYESNGDAHLLAQLVLGEDFQPWFKPFH